MANRQQRLSRSTGMAAIYAIRPLFVSVTPSLTLTDHDGQPASDEAH
jgi:hypothetical protein